MKKIIFIIAAALVLITGACGENAAVNNSIVHDPAEQITDPQEALNLLREGNKRYIENKTITRETNAEDREILKDGQQPFAVIVTCSDSRVSPEIYFDQKHGDIFVVRNAGNIADYSALGSIEYAVEHLRAPLVVVVGHSRCGAVGGAFSGGEYSENLQAVIGDIASVIKDAENIDEAIYANIDGVCKIIEENKVVAETGAVVLGAYYNIESGEVIFYNAE
ncbi:MAG: carbonic anhydrase [Oscillospiraceae bacterium]|nr:carbonic anhydrase [Oscillospiraceae bacterium]